MVVLEVSSARLGATSIAGGEQRSEARVSAIRTIETKGKEIEDVLALYTTSGVCWRSTIPAATADVALGVAVSTSCASSGEDEDDDLRLVYIHHETVSGSVSDGGLGRADGLMLGCGGPIGMSLFFLFSLLFSVFSVLYLLYLNSVFNSNLFCRILNVWILLGVYKDNNITSYKILKIFYM
jgi:hypothetical protein